MMRARQIVPVCILAACSCGRTPARAVADCPTLVRTYFALPLRQRIQEFKTHDIDTQYRIYICGNQALEPPALYLAPQFASGGLPVAALLKGKLAAGVDDPTTRDILQVFVAMAHQHSYDVKNDSVLMQLIETRTRAIRDPQWRTFAEKLVGEIAQHDSSEAPHT